VRVVLAALAAALLLEAWFVHETATRGLLSPRGAPHLGVLLLGAVYLVTRVTVRLGAPFLLAYVAVRAALRAFARRLGRRPAAVSDDE
jgi:hypothetical protein